MTIKLLVADDQEVIRNGIAEMVKGEDIKIVATATTGPEALEKTVKHRPHVLLMDVMMPGVDGLDTLEKLRDAAPKTKVVIMSAHANNTYVARSVALGAIGFLLKDASRKEVLAAIRCAAEGTQLEGTDVLKRIRDSLGTRLDPVKDKVPLTKREYQVLRHLAFGLSNREIGFSLEISIETVKEHVQNVLRKLNAADRTEAAVWAVKKKLVDVG